MLVEKYWNLTLERIFVSNEYNDEFERQTRILHTFELNARVNGESNEIQNNERDNQNFSTKTASRSVLRLLTKNEIFGLEADSLEVISVESTGDHSSTEENDLGKVFFKIVNNPCDNQLDFVYFLGPWKKCSIRFSFLCEKYIDISTIEKMNIQDWMK